MDDIRRPIRHANEFWDHYGTYIQTRPEAGDIIFFSRHGVLPTHIGIVLDEESYIHAPGKADTKVRVGKIATNLIIGKETVDRILFETNPIGFKSPMLTITSPTYRHHQQLAE